jgi:anthranilate synthase component 1
MTTLITSDKFNTYKAEGFNFIPLVKSFDVGHETPLSIYQKLANLPFSYLLESVEGGERFGRYSIIGLPSKKRIVIRGDVIEVIDQNKVIKKEDTQNPLDFIQNYLSQFKVPHDLELPRFSGGLAGYFGYETIQYIESRLKHKKTKDTLGVPDILLMQTEEFVVFDNLKGVMTLVVHADLASDPLGENAFARLDQISLQLKQPLHNQPLPINLASQYVEKGASLPLSQTSFRSNFTEQGYCEVVEKIKQYILSGDVMQVLPSQRMSAPFQHPPLSLYRTLRMINPSPYMYLLNLDDFHIVGSSPEILVRVDQGTVTLRPIAGTRRRGKTPTEDQALELELLSDPKEIAEHVMLIDLGRNDVGRVAEYGSVRLTDKMVVERYSHVMHIVSNVEGKLREGLSAFDVLKAAFPAGTLSGAPKIRAMEILSDLEPVKRGVYGGAVGYLSFQGDLDTAIAIRTAVIKEGEIHVQAGAGVVADSIPHLEWQETLSKGQVLLNAASLLDCQ